ncbi:MAG: TolC family protein [Campylobacterales bacterium]
MRFFIMVAFMVISLNAETLDIKKAIDIALKNSPKIHSAKLNLQISEQDIRLALSTYYPSLDLVSKYTKQNDNYNRYTQKNTQLKIGGEITQNIYDFGRTSSAYDSAKIGKKKNLKLFEESLNNIIFEVRDGLNQVYKNLYLLDIAIEENSIMKERESQIYGLYQGGLRSKYDVTTVKLKVINTDKSIKKVRGMLNKSIDDLKKIIGSKQDIAIDKSNYKVEIETIKEHLKKIDIDKKSLIKKMLENNPELHSFEYATKQKRENIRSKEAELLPELEFVGSGYRYPKDSYSPDFQSEYKNSWEAGVRFSWNVFDGFRDDVAMQKASIEHLKSNSELEEQRLELTNRLENATTKASESKSVLHESFKEIELAKENVAIARSQYSSGLIDIWQYLLSEENLIETKRSLVENYYSLLSSLYEIEYLTGSSKASSSL